MMVGITWWREHDWPRVKDLFPDAGELHNTYAEWLKSAENTVKELKRRGVAVEQFALDIDDFLAWCLVHERQRDAQARSEYVTEKLRLKHQSPLINNRGDSHA
jgi:hypothetical protein